MGECGAVEIDLDLRRRTVLPLFGSSFLLLTGAKRGVVRRPVTAALTASTPPASLQDITATATVAGPVHLATTYVEGLCIDAGTAALRTLVKVQQCGPGAAVNQDFTTPAGPVDGTMATDGSFHIVHKASGLCLSGEHSGTGVGTAIDLFGCEPKGNMLWTLDRYGRAPLRARRPPYDLAAFPRAFACQ